MMAAMLLVGIVGALAIVTPRSARPLNHLYEPLSKLLVSPLIDPIVVPYIVPYITPL